MVSARTAEALIGAAVKPFRGEGRRTIAAAVAAAISVVWDKLNKEKGLVQNSGKQWVRRPDGRAALHQATAQQSAGKTERKRRRRQKLKQKKREKLEANRRADGGGDEVQPMEVSSTGVTMAPAAAAASGVSAEALGIRLPALEAGEARMRAKESAKPAVQEEMDEGTAESVVPYAPNASLQPQTGSAGSVEKCPAWELQRGGKKKQRKKVGCFRCPFCDVQKMSPTPPLGVRCSSTMRASFMTAANPVGS